MIRDGIRPRPRVQIKDVAGWGEDARGFVILVRIPKSFGSPHMVTFKGTSRFCSRNSAGKYPLNVDEIRSAFAASEALPERIKRFRDDRLAKIVADETPVQLEPDPKIVLHLMPLAAFSHSYQVDLTAIDRLRRTPGPMEGRLDRSRFNLDGFVEWSWKRPPKCCDYYQVFRSGIIEAVDASLPGEWNGRRVIPSARFEHHVLCSVKRYIAILRALDGSLPIVIALALLGFKGYELGVQPGHKNYDPTPIDRDVLVLPDVPVEGYESDVASVMRPIFDGVWTAAGYAQSMNYDENGNWEIEIGGHFT
jgi:hypothetical protein